MPRIVQAARDESHEISLWNRLVKVNILTVLLSDNFKDNHFILEKYIQYKNGCTVEMDAVVRGEKKREIISNSGFPTPTESSSPTKSILPKTTRQAQKYFSKTVPACQRACQVLTEVTGART